MSIQTRLSKLEARTPTPTDDVIRIAWFDPDTDIEPMGFVDDDGVTTLRLPDESVVDLRHRAQENSVWVDGHWHDYTTIY